MGGSRPTPAVAPASPAAVVTPLREPASAAIQRKRFAEGRTAIITTGVDEDATKATKQLLGS